MKTPPHSLLAAAPAAPAPPRVLMLGTALEGQGGIASVVAVLRQDGLFEREGVRYLATHAEGSRSAKAWHALRGLAQAALILLRERPAIVHAHTASRASFFRKSLLLWLARASGARTVFHLHGASFREFATAESGPLARRWIRHTLEASSAVIALSPAWADFLRAYAPAAEVHVVPNSVRVERAAGAADGAAGDSGRILFLGRAGERKGLFDLLEALAQVVPDFPEARLAIGGDGDLDEVRRRCGRLGIGAHVQLLGWLGPEQKAAELARAAIFCLPSHAEGLPMAMLEAMAAARPVLVTPVGGIPDAVSDGDNGLVVAPRDVPALAAALAALLGDAALRERLGRNGRATIVQRFSTEVVLGKLAALYRALAQRGPR